MRIPPDVSRSQIEQAIFEWLIGERSERNRSILYDSLIRGLTHEQIAEAYEMSPRQIGTIIRNCTKQIFKHLPSR